MHLKKKIDKRMWRNWYTRTLEVRVALCPWEFESPHPHTFQSNYSLSPSVQ
jgi:hypothetical protein